MMHSCGVIFYLDGLGAGGIARVCLTLCEEFIRRGVRVGFVLAEDRIELKLPSDAWLRVNKDSCSGAMGRAHKYPEQSLVFFERAVNEFESAFGSSVVIAAGDRVPYIAAQSCHKWLLNSVHASKLGAQKLPGYLGRTRQLFKLWRRSSDVARCFNGRPLHCVSNGLASELVDDFGVMPSTLSVIYNPFDFKKIRQQSLVPTVESLAQDKPFIVSVGRFVRSKRFDRLVESFSKCEFDGDLVLIGQGEEENTIRKVIRDFSLENRVKIVRFHENHHALVAKAKLFAMTSDAEGLPNVLIESLAVGVPVVSLDCRFGPAEIVSPFCADAIIPMKQFDRFSEAMDRFVKDPYLIDESYLQRFDICHVADQYVELFDRIRGVDVDESI